MKKISVFIPCLLLLLISARSQNLHAIQGSSYAGILGVANNPASIVNTADAWDLNVLSLQMKASTNAVKVLNYSLLSSPSKSLYMINGGDFSRYVKGNYNLHLFNTRIAINRRHSVAFGVNLRGYVQLNTGRYDYNDTLSSLRSFLRLNEKNPSLQGDLTSSTWMEIFGTYSLTLMDSETGRLNAGLTVKGTRGVSGLFAKVRNAGVRRTIEPGRAVYLVSTGEANYGYSANFDKWQTGQSASQNVNTFLTSSEGSLSADLGIEYLVKTQAVTNVHDEDGYYDYEWKIGVSILDIGRNQYKYGRESRYVANFKENVSDRDLERKFIDTDDLSAYNDSLATILNTVQRKSGRFAIINPTRLVLNVDRYLFDDFYLNAEVCANLSFLVGRELLYTSELNFLSITPRWETRRLGIYLPLQYNTENQFWIGAAFKAGPLLLGVHNLGNVFAKDKMQNGGGYIALVIKPGGFTKAYRDRRMDCPR